MLRKSLLAPDLVLIFLRSSISARPSTTGGFSLLFRVGPAQAEVPHQDFMFLV
jgi:hypothetical protein